MRVANAGTRSWGADDPRFRNDLRGRLGVVLSMDRKAPERAPRQAGGETRCAVHAVSRDCDEGPLTRLRNMMRIFKRVDALEARMDGMAEWLEGRQ